MSPGFGFFKRKTSVGFGGKNDKSNPIQTTHEELLEIVGIEKKRLENDLITDLEPERKSVVNCLESLRHAADELEEQKIKVENPRFEPLINNSKRILISSIKKESFIGSSEIDSYEDAVSFKNNLELLVNRFGQVGESHNRILNEFMRKQLHKLKNEFENLSLLLKDVTKIISANESRINKIAECTNNLILLGEKIDERNDKRQKLLELSEEKENIDKNFDANKRQYEDFQKSKQFQNITDTLQRIKDKKDEIQRFEDNIISKFSGLSRPITKYSYLASKQTQQRLTILQNKPLDIFKDEHEFTQLFTDLRKHVLEEKIQIKDPEKTIHLIDEIINSMDTLSTKLKKMRQEQKQLESSVNSQNVRQMENIKAKREMYEKNSSENVSKIEETKNMICELDSIIEGLKKKIEESVAEITNTNYYIEQLK